MPLPRLVPACCLLAALTPVAPVLTSSVSAQESPETTVRTDESAVFLPLPADSVGLGADASLRLDEILVAVLDPAHAARLAAEQGEDAPNGGGHFLFRNTRIDSLEAYEAWLTRVRALPGVTAVYAKVRRQRGGVSMHYHLGSTVTLRLNDAAGLDTLRALDGWRILEVEEGRRPIVQLTRPDASPLGVARKSAELADLTVVERLQLSLSQDRQAMALPSVPPNDPFFDDQWHLDSLIGDIDVMDTWTDYTGLGMQIAIVDTGIDIDHPDLAANMRADLQYDAACIDFDANYDNAAQESHSTAVAGGAAAVGNNSLGVCGTAPEADIVAVRLLASNCPVTDAAIGRALSHNVVAGDVDDEVDVSNNSWGPNGGMDPIDLNQERAFNYGTFFGRRGVGDTYGHGISYVFASGNSHDIGDTADWESALNRLEVIAIGSSHSAAGKAVYSETGNCLFACAPGGDFFFGGAFGEGAYVTTDIEGVLGYNDGSDGSNPDYAFLDDSVVGTSFASPTAAGAIAIILEANPQLNWRDIRHIIANSSDKIDASHNTWTRNAAGKEFSRYFGFGRINVRRAVALARGWNHAPPMYDLNPDPPANDPTDILSDHYTPLTVSSGTLNVQLPGGTDPKREDVLVCDPPLGFYVESVVLRIEGLDHPDRREMSYWVTSPSGTRHVIDDRILSSGLRFPIDDFWNEVEEWDYKMNGFWGEDPRGEWTVRWVDSHVGNTGTLESFSLIFHGYVLPDPDAEAVAVDSTGNAIVFAGDTGIQVKVNGSGYVAADADEPNYFAGSLITLNGTSVPTTVNSLGELVTSGDVDAWFAGEGTVKVGVRNPVFDGHGGNSNEMDVTVVAEQPVIISDPVLEVAYGATWTQELKVAPGLLANPGNITWSIEASSELDGIGGIDFNLTSTTGQTSSVTLAVPSSPSVDDVYITIKATYDDNGREDIMRFVVALAPPSSITDASSSRSAEVQP